MITDWYYTSDELENWIVDSTQFHFEMVDQNGITREFLNRNNQHYFSGGSSYFAGIKYSKSEREYYYQQFSSNYQDSYNISINPALNSYWGEQITFYLNDLHFTYDYLFDEVINIETNGHYEYLRINSDGIQGDSLFGSKFKILDRFEVDNHWYENVFHFHLEDFKSSWNEFTITDVYYAQNTGLLRYEMNNGLVFERVRKD